MKHAEKIAFEHGFEAAVKAASDVVSDVDPDQDGRVSYQVVMDIFAAIASVRPDRAVARMSSPVDYLANVQSLAHAAWYAEHGMGSGLTGPQHDAIAGLDTPIGRLKVIAWRRPWAGKRGARVAWAGEYYLNDAPITVAEIRAAGLADRRFKRNRSKKSR